MEQQEAIYLRIHYMLTKKAIAEHIHKFNSAIEKEFNADQKAFREKYCLKKETQTYKCVIITAAIEATVLGILDMYAKFLEKNSGVQCTDPKFKVTNKGVRTKRNGLYDKKTAHLHIKRATLAGIFDKNKYVYHGTNSGFQIGFNDSLLVACMDERYTEMIVNNYINSVDKSVISQEKLSILSTIRPLFSDSANGCIATNCNYINVPVLLQELNINMDDTIPVENSLLTQTDSNRNIYSPPPEPTRTKQEHGSIHQEKSLGSIALNFIHLATKEQEQALRARKIEKVEQTEDINILRFYVSSAIKLILSVLYRDRFVTEADLRLATKDIQLYFSRKNSGKSLSELSDDLWLAVMEAYKSKRRTGFTPAPLHKYLDVYFKGGLLSTTLDHVEKNVKPYMARNKDITQSIDDANQWYQKFVKSKNNAEIYRQATQNLNKKKNKAYLDFFNEAVVEHKNFNKQIIYQTIINQ